MLREQGDFWAGPNAGSHQSEAHTVPGLNPNQVPDLIDSCKKFEIILENIKRPVLGRGHGVSLPT